MRNLLLPVLWLGLAGPVAAHPPAATASAESATTSAAHPPLSPIGAAMANLSRALHDAAEQARRPAAADSTKSQPLPADTPRPQDPRPQPTAQAALP